MKLIDETIHYIEDHLEEGPSVDQIASLTPYSKFHFQRLFAHHLGLSIGEYINGRQLTKAAQTLCRTDKRIIEIAQDAGFPGTET